MSEKLFVVLYGQKINFIDSIESDVFQGIFSSVEKAKEYINKRTENWDDGEWEVVLENFWLVKSRRNKTNVYEYEIRGTDLDEPFNRYIGP